MRGRYESRLDLADGQAHSRSRASQATSGTHTRCVASSGGSAGSRCLPLAPARNSSHCQSQTGSESSRRREAVCSRAEIFHVQKRRPSVRQDNRSLSSPRINQSLRNAHLPRGQIAYGTGTSQLTAILKTRTAPRRPLNFPARSNRSKESNR